MGSFQLGAAASYWALRAVPGCYRAAEDMWGSAVAAGSLAPAKHLPLFLVTVRSFSATATTPSGKLRL
jgi:hypothetical protein